MARLVALVEASPRHLQQFVVLVCYRHDHCAHPGFRHAQALGLLLDHLPDGVLELDEPRVALDGQRTRALERHVEHALDAAGPRAHHHDPIGQVHRLVDLVRDEQHCLARARPDLEELRLHVLARLRVERGKRLVHQQHHRIRRQRPRQVDPLLHAAGELGRVVPLEAAEPDQLDEVVGALAHGCPVEPLVHLHAVAHVAGDGPPREEAGVLEHDRPVHAGAVHASAVDGHRAHLVVEKTGHDVEECRLAAAARTDNGHELALRHRQRNVGQGQHLSAVTLDVVALGQSIDV